MCPFCSKNKIDTVPLAHEVCVGRLPWYGKGPRKTIFYKYCPMNLAWNQHIFPMDENGDVPYEGLSERAREMLVPAGGLRHFHLRRETLARRAEEGRPGARL